MSDLGTPRRIPFDQAKTRRSVFAALVGARAEFGGAKVALVDGDERTLTYDEIIRGSFALGSALKRGTRRGECVGIMLPTGMGAVLAFFALSAFGRIPTMLNFSSGLTGLKSALRTAGVKRVVTARRLVAAAGLEAVVAALGAEIVYLEDVREQLSLKDKLRAVAGNIAPHLLA